MQVSGSCMPIRLQVRVPRGTTMDVSEHTFTRAVITVGRSPECDLVLPGDEVRVSRQHIRVERREAEIVRGDPKEGAALRAMQSISKSLIGADDFQTPEQLTLFGELIRVSLEILLEGLFQTLSARKEFEGEFDASVSMAYQRQSNPLKMMQELERFKKFPVDWKTSTDVMAVKDSLERAIKDVSQHQMGLLAGMQQVLE